MHAFHEHLIAKPEPDRIPEAELPALLRFIASLGPGSDQDEVYLSVAAALEGEDGPAKALAQTIVRTSHLDAADHEHDALAALYGRFVLRGRPGFESSEPKADAA